MVEDLNKLAAKAEAESRWSDAQDCKKWITKVTKSMFDELLDERYKAPSAAEVQWPTVRTMEDHGLSCEWNGGKCVWSDEPSELRRLRRTKEMANLPPNGIPALSSAHDVDSEAGDDLLETECDDEADYQEHSKHE